MTPRIGNHCILWEAACHDRAWKVYVYALAGGSSRSERRNLIELLNFPAPWIGRTSSAQMKEDHRAEHESAAKLRVEKYSGFQTAGATYCPRRTRRARQDEDNEACGLHTHVRDVATEVRGVRRCPLTLKHGLALCVPGYGGDSDGRGGILPSRES
ncbi:hypothetical protein C8Q80DRAFT_1122093 [Daedaleopsis nitida]|nr:hypothetical protein C8Q80DRAFT_1122093 [Daedaleopsis nitida]